MVDYDTTSESTERQDLLIEARSLEKSFHLGKREILVLKKIDLQIFHHEFIAIVGPSGAGKSTLLHLLGMLEVPSGGEVQILGHPVNSLDEKSKAMLRCREIGFVFQFHHLLPGFTALENVMMPGRILGSPLGELREKAQKLLSSLGLADRLENKPAELSGGEQQRVAVARAMINSPTLILADEPSGNLDRETGKQLEEDLLMFARKNKATVVIVTHNQEWADKADRTLRLLDGRIGEASEAYTK